MQLVRALRVAAFGFVATSSWGCHDKEPITAPTTVRMVPNRDMQSLPPFSQSLGVTGPNLTLPTYDFTEGIKVEIRIEGLVTVLSDSRAPYVNAASLSLDPKGVWVGGIYNRCYVSAHVSYPTSPGPRTDFSPGNGCVIPHTMVNYIDTGLVRGAGTAIRDAQIPVNSVPCDTIVCHQYSGSQTVTITPLAADLDFRATYNGARRRTVFVPPFVNDSGNVIGAGYYQIIFTDSTSPRGMPERPLQKTWVLADPTAPGHWFYHHTNILDCGSPVTVYCALNVKESGTMVSQTRVNGVEHTDSAAVQCSLTDAVLNLPAVRAALLDLADSTHGTSSNLNLRREQVAAVFQNRTTGAITVVTALQDSSDRCFSYWNPLTPAWAGPDDSLIAYVHTHPTVAGETYACVNARDSANRRPGASTSDSVARAQVNSRQDYGAAGWNPTWYIMAMDYIYRMDAANSPASHRSAGKWWKTNLCAWIRLPDHTDVIFRMH